MMSYKYLTDKDLGDLKYFLMDDDHKNVTKVTLLWSNDGIVTTTLENAGVMCIRVCHMCQNVKSSRL